MQRTIGMIGAMDTKGTEFAFLKREIERKGFGVLVFDTGVMGEPMLRPDVSRKAIAEAGGAVLAELVAQADRGKAMAAMAEGVTKLVRESVLRGDIQGLIGMGGTAGTAVASSAMRALPVGFPKLIVSTVAAGDTRGYVGMKDIVMMPAVVDVAGINRISRQIFTRAAGAICGMALADIEPAEDRKLIAASMFGNTTSCVERARERLEREDTEVLVFHCTGVGGRTMESLIDGGYIGAVLDITTTEWADEIAGGVFAAGPDRGDAAGRRGIPQVIVPGCVDMVNFHARDTVPDRYAGRNLYEWNPNITLMRTTAEENARIGAILAEKANASAGPVAFVLPIGGVSQLDSPGRPFWDSEADRACFDAIRQHVRSGIPVHEMACNINDPEFSDRVAQLLLDMMSGQPR
ncbi:Uncharacterized protein, UPF0261 family [Paenibacillus sp. UNC496MF]|uniref:Tm-1-like ATP-binding domain-containing protein n=1 Tax=Paenibacillus sp. UNC496MF TaxID=1502753 RepID=UPI0008E291EE|nr:Tm-1-like ATP-binding domain-containing protein [Paenibacillus sp. UNC496MF]SFI42165.1 Uncharacterized protein, UPF0261 family [Paenibacillus sp. UNC496MF]